MWASPAGAVSSTIATAGSRQIDGLPLGAFSSNLSLAPKRVSDQSFAARAHSAVASSSTSILGCFSNVRSRAFVALASSRKQKEESSPSFAADEEDDFDGLEDEDEDVIDDDEDAETAPMPFEEMSRWLRNKPSGFGKGKSYDTSIEDKLMEEIDQSRQAQALNLKNLKNRVAGQEISKKKNHQNPGAAEDALIGVRVRIAGLPRKKNVHRDLKLAFIDFPNILNIIPAVEGNKKTRDPICKGFAYVDFKSAEAAQKFAETYSRQSIPFGRVQKQITCSIVDKPNPSNYSSEKIPQISFSDNSKDTDRKSIPSGTQEHDKELTSASLPKVESPGLKREAPVVVRKKSPRKKRDKAPVLSIHGSALRLKVKERAVLTGVLSKYGGQPAEISPQKN